MKRFAFPTLAVMAAAIIVLRSHAVQIYGAPEPSAMMSVQELHEKTDLQRLSVEEFEDQSLVSRRGRQAAMIESRPTNLRT